MEASPERLASALDFASARWSRGVRRLCCVSAIICGAVIIVFAVRENAVVSPPELCKGAVVTYCPPPGVNINGRCYFFHLYQSHGSCSQSCAMQHLYFAEIENLDTWNTLMSRQDRIHFNAINARKPFEWYEKNFGVKCRVDYSAARATIMLGRGTCELTDPAWGGQCLCVTSI